MPIARARYRSVRAPDLANLQELGPSSSSRPINFHALLVCGSPHRSARSRLSKSNIHTAGGELHFSNFFPPTTGEGRRLMNTGLGLGRRWVLPSKNISRKKKAWFVVPTVGRRRASSNLTH